MHDTYAMHAMHAMCGTSGILGMTHAIQDDIHDATARDLDDCEDIPIAARALRADGVRWLRVKAVGPISPKGAPTRTGTVVATSPIRRVRADAGAPGPVR